MPPVPPPDVKRRAVARPAATTTSAGVPAGGPQPPPPSPKHQILPLSPPRAFGDDDVREAATSRARAAGAPAPGADGRHLAIAALAEYLTSPRGAWLVERWVEKSFPLVRELAVAPDMRAYLDAQRDVLSRGELDVTTSFVLHAAATGPWDDRGIPLDDASIRERLRLEMPGDLMTLLGQLARAAGARDDGALDVDAFADRLLGEGWRLSLPSRRELVEDLRRVQEDLRAAPLRYSAAELRSQVVQSRLKLAERAAWRFGGEVVAQDEGEHPLLQRGRLRVAEARSLMPVLDDVTRALGGPDALSSFSLRAVQHLLPDTAVLLEHLAKNGVDRGAAQIFGKSYSTDPAVALVLAETGWNQDAFRIRDEPGLAALDELGANLGARPDMLLLDDGGELILEHVRKRLSDPARTVAVEQTEKGVIRLEGVDLPFPVVNVAQSRVKKQVERALIGEGVASATTRLGAEMNEALFERAPKTAVVVGFGAVGSETAQALRRRGFAVSVLERDPDARRRAREAGFDVGGDDERSAILSRAHLLVSCTGRTAVDEADLDLLPDEAVVANGASGHDEIARPLGAGHEDALETVDATGVRHTTFRGLDLALGAKLDEGQPDEHRVVRTKGGKRILYVRSGGVVNLGQGTPPVYFQLVSGLLLGASLQAARSLGRRGLVDLDEDIQAFVEARTKKALAAHGLSLQTPDFDRARAAAATPSRRA